MSDKNKSFLPTEFIVALVMVAAAVAVTLVPGELLVRSAVVILIFGATVFYLLLYFWRKQQMVQVAAQLLGRHAGKADKYANAVSMPTAIARPDGKILYHNPAFILLAGRPCEGRNIRDILPLLEKPEKDKKYKIGGVSYYKEINDAELDGRKYMIYRLVDTSNAYESAELYKTVMTAVCHLQVDNYEDLLRGIPQIRHLEIQADVDRIVAAYAEKLEAVYQKYGRDRYLLVFERRHLAGLFSNKFEILNEVKQIDTGSAALRPTLSLGLGVGKSPELAGKNALRALEMALGRGGDQAVLAGEEGFEFFGGVQQGREKRTRVKSRMFASALRNLMDQCNNVVIMGHNVPDLDCMGAAMGILACARKTGRKAYIVVDRPNAVTAAMLDAMSQDPDYKGVVVTPAESEQVTDAQSMLVVVDTQIAAFTAAPALLNKTETVVVIDHHVRGTNSIEGATLVLHEPYASSASEMVTEIVEYFSQNMVLKPLEVEALLAGITMDTKGFSFKTGVRTFEAASYLRQMGADTTKIRALFQDDLETFTARSKIVENAEVLPGGIAIAICPPELKNPQLLAAQAADSLVGIRGIAASFVLCRRDTEIMISGRSLGGINVQRILEKMGGGGHATIAGAQIKSADMDAVVAQLKEKIAEYEKEV